MSRRPAILLLLGAPVSAHRLDEYLQATLISIEKDQVQASMRLIPGVAVSSAVLASIDSNGDGVISETEGRAYAERVLSEVSLGIDGHPLKPRLISVSFPAMQEMKDGLGEIQIEFSASLTERRSRAKTYLRESPSKADGSLPGELSCTAAIKTFRSAAQDRNEDQSFYQLTYRQDGSRQTMLSLSWLGRLAPQPVWPACSG